ncbi:DNA mismatch repair protein MutT [Pseudomonas sp. IsoF]|nr:DNA mismatch repair protein MutT [Pseudomonas sp. IsoF]
MSGCVLPASAVDTCERMSAYDAAPLFIDTEINMLPDKACAVVLSPSSPPCILLFRHPLAGVQLVKGSIENGETPREAALRELHEESGIHNATIGDDLGCWDSGHLGQTWSFHLCRAEGVLPERWLHQTLDDHGHTFEFFWAALDHLPYAECHPVFQRALGYLSNSLKLGGHWPDAHLLGGCRNDRAGL